MAYENLGQRLVRYSSTVRAIEALLSWWSSLNDTSRAGEGTIAQLVQSGEQIITSERLSWQTMMPQSEDGAEGAKDSSASKRKAKDDAAASSAATSK